MKINFSYKFMNLDKTIIRERPDEFEMVDGEKKLKKKYPPFTLRIACVNVLLGGRVNQIKCPKCGTEIDKIEVLTGEEKSQRYMLAHKIYNSSALLDISTTDIELLKKLIAHVYPQLTSGQAWAILDPHSDN